MHDIKLHLCIMRKLIALLLICSGILMSSCNNDDSEGTPKPRGYYRIDFPKHTYKKFEPASCPFSFDIPEYALAIPDTNGRAEACWYYLIFPKFNGEVYFTYKSLNGDLERFTEDTRTLVYKHTAKASSINEKVLDFGNGVSGIFYDIGGDAASPTQFFVTDSAKHFLRGSLYFNAAPNSDSLAPVVKYIKEDMLHLLETVKWK